VAIDGFPASQWIVLDYLQVVVHVFHRDKRASIVWRTFGATRRGSSGKRTGRALSEIWSAQTCLRFGNEATCAS